MTTPRVEPSRERGDMAAARFGARLLRDESGVAAIEMAFLMMFAIFIVLGTIELALDMIVDATVQIAAQQASRVGLTTSAPTNGNTRAQQAQAQILGVLKPWTNMGGTVTFTTLNYGTYNNVGTSSSQASMGGYGDVVSYNISLTMNSFTGIPKLLGQTGTFTYSRNYLVQNEK
ncbi:pilus assembly protein [Caballeronia sp. LZ062]|uniref:TadE/TadG family type IV pilus assembly protein n=1 Tax=unclassified Caballeronia TaxID=2646786 RepID=UPI002861C49D|nr:MULTISPECIES: pilus assembly protein [unclassified Caballeronia]MDR5857607.1 pilus assembly protein [Caballeronia sp. LZ050]MDR5869157.1 pilus assembly protein [Caballeronia sp. LZ062]